MIRNVGHQQTRAWHVAHTKRHRRSWVLMMSVLVIAAIFIASGYFETVSWGDLIAAVLFTTYRLLIAYGIALVVGVTIGLLVGWSPLSSDFLFPFFDILQNIPSFALIPLFIFAFGFTDIMIILFAVSSITWPILFAILTAIKSAHRDLSDAAAVFGARGLRRIFFYLAPLSFPAILTGSIVGIAVGWESVIGAEIIANIGNGFGLFIRDASATGINQTTIAGILAILVIVFEINRLVWAPLLAESSKLYAE